MGSGGGAGGKQRGGSTGEKYDILAEFVVVYFISITIYRGCRVGGVIIRGEAGGVMELLFCNRVLPKRTR